MRLVAVLSEPPDYDYLKSPLQALIDVVSQSSKGDDPVKKWFFVTHMILERKVEADEAVLRVR
jgi:hypothetical protein